ncbi:unnamed protein product [Lactuca virosa]|uniref:Uncharacterized protein n=1 Tax=Lactuca virosa TaxID=75947 RepID=A0AAU9MUC4_9ASTR|nr:unnamed protein product [Lactuca virosa]
MKSERIKNTYSLMKYKNDPSNPIIIDIDVDASDSIRITPIPTIAKAGVMTQRSKSKPVSTVKPIHKEGQHSRRSVSVQVLYENRSKQKFDPDSNSHSPVHGYTKSDFEDPNPFINQNKRKSSPLVTYKVVQHQEKKARADVANPQAFKAKVKVKKLENRKSKKGVPVGIPTQPRRIHIRTSPKILFSTMHGLTNGQKEYLSSIGFGPLLNIKVDGSASRIGYYAVNNFDPERMVLNVERGEIPITRQLIHDMLGLPLGNININSLKFRPAEDKTVDLWSAQFKSENDIRPKGVQTAI